MVSATYVSLIDQKQNELRRNEYEKRIEDLRKLSPEEQKEADTLYRQGSDLGYKAIAELKNKNQAEADRLRADANKAYAASKTIQQAHLERVFPQMQALISEEQAAMVRPEVKVRVMAHDLALDQRTVKKDPVQIEGVGKAYYTVEKMLVLSLDSSPDGSPMWVAIEGDRKQAETIGRLFGQSSEKAAFASR